MYIKILLMYTEQYIKNLLKNYNNAKKNGSISDKNKYYNKLLQIKIYKNQK
jgi:hypothetical protein